MVNAVRPLLGVFHLGEQGVPPGGTVRSTWGNVNHGFLHGFTMEESESTSRTSTSPCGARRCRSRKWGPLGFPRVRGQAWKARLSPWAR